MTTNKSPEWIIGIDEVGRGPIAGPVTVCAFISRASFNIKNLFPKQTVRDSKKTNKTIRNNMFKSLRYLRKSKEIEINWAIASKSAKYIDTHGIIKSIDKCISQCVKSLNKKGYSLNKAMFYLDGGLSLKRGHFRQETIIRGDELVGQIAVASIIAKEHRDHYMTKMSKVHPFFAWESNSGYGTNLHYKALKNHKLSPLHRKSFIH